MSIRNGANSSYAIWWSVHSEALASSMISHTTWMVPQILIYQHQLNLASIKLEWNNWNNRTIHLYDFLQISKSIFTDIHKYSSTTHSEISTHVLGNNTTVSGHTEAQNSKPASIKGSSLINFKITSLCTLISMMMAGHNFISPTTYITPMWQTYSFSQTRKLRLEND